jgi:hypothetical protein
MLDRAVFSLQGGARFLLPAEEHDRPCLLPIQGPLGKAMALSPVGTRGGVLAEQRPGADLGVAAVIRALGGDLGGYRPAGYVRAAVTSEANSQRWLG